MKLKFIVLGFIFTVSTLYAVQYRCFEEEEYEYSLSTNFGEQVPNDANAFASNYPYRMRMILAKGKRRGRRRRRRAERKRKTKETRRNLFEGVAVVVMMRA